MKNLLILLISFFATFQMHAEETRKEKKQLLLEGKPNPGAIGAGIPFPAMDGRPDTLRPESLPERVRYKFAPDQAVVVAADLVSTHLLAEPKGENALFGDSVIVQPGAWKWLKPLGGMGKKAATPMDGSVAIRNKRLTLAGMYLRDKEEIDTLEKALRQIIREDGGGVVRALKSAEMDKWWTFIGFDIEEPTLVIATKNQKHLFVLSFSKDHLLVVDELNALPN